MILRHKVAYCTLNSVIQQMYAESNNKVVSTTSSENTQISVEDANKQAYLKRLIYEVSATMSKVMGLVFVPTIRTKTYTRPYIAENLRRADVYEYHLMVDDELLDITSITWISTALTASQYRLAHADFAPDYAVAIDSNAISALPSAFTENVQVVGTWGYHTNPDDMWVLSSSTVQDNPLSASATSVTVGTDEGATFEVLQYLKIESEFLLITSISGDVLTVERGVNGSTASSHVQSTAIYTYKGLPEVENEARRLAIRHWHLRGLPDNFVVTAEEAIEINPNAVQKVVTPLAKFWTM